MFPPVLVTGPQSLPLDKERVRAHCRLDDFDQDELVDLYIQSARAHVEGWKGTTGQCLINQTWRQDFRSFGECMRLPLFPVQSITNIKYWDTANPESQQTLSGDVYELLEDAEGPYVGLKYGQQWPNIGNTTRAVSVTFLAGYGASFENVPADIRHAMMLMISHWYENRETVVVGVSSMPIPMGAATLLSKHRRVGF